MKSLLLVGWSQAERPDLDPVLATSGMTVHAADTPADALALLAVQDAIVLVDLASDTASGAIDAMLDGRPGTRIIAVAPAGQVLAADAPIRTRVLAVLPRPLAARDLVLTLSRLRLMDMAGLRAIPSAPVAAHGFVGRSARLREVIALIEKAAWSRGGVLITGERGTGRERAARAIHECSPRAAGPFVTVTCSHMPPHEINATLFGTAPDMGRPNHPPRQSHESIYPGGLLDAAQGGTVLFHDLGEMPDRVQSKLARLFRDGEFLAGGRGKPQPIGFRPMAAAGPDHEADVNEGRVRLDLYRRLASTHIAIPPLRDRREDIPALAVHFVEQACLNVGAPARPITSSAMAVLSALPWKGNAHELRGIVETLVLKAKGDSIELDDVLGHVRLEGGASTVTLVGMMGPLKKARVHFEREYIAAVLEHHHGRVPEAARTLGIQRTNLYRKLRSLHLVKPNGASARAAG